jgi:hypothetical protein
VCLAPQPLEALPETPPRVLLDHRLRRRDHLGISLKRRPRFSGSTPLENRVMAQARTTESSCSAARNIAAARFADGVTVLIPILPRSQYSHHDVAVVARFCYWLGGGPRSYFRRIPCSTICARS